MYGAIAIYLANRDEVLDYLKRQEQRWEDVRARVAKNPSAIVERLRAKRKHSGGKPDEPPSSSRG